MASLVVSGDTSGAITLSAPAVAGTNTLSLPAQTATLATLTTPSFATTIGVGGATAAASGAGITFPASQSASSDANTLDDYEEGTWTPTVAPASGSLTAYVSSGVYVKIGRLVNVIGVFTLTTPGTASGYGSFGGLPFTANGPSGAYRDSVGTAREDAATGVFYQVYVGPSSGNFAITTTADGPITWGTNYEYLFNITYQT